MQITKELFNEISNEYTNITSIGGTYTIANLIHRFFCADIQEKKIEKLLYPYKTTDLINLKINEKSILIFVYVDKGSYIKYILLKYALKLTIK